MEFGGECIYDFDIIDIAERSPVQYLEEKQKASEDGLRTSKSWCGPLNHLIGKKCTRLLLV